MSRCLEQAYWTLLCMVERLLPASFFSPDLLASRADQLVLADLVAQLIPKLHQHLEELGVDMASLTFGWFLSLFTDCLPVEVSLAILIRVEIDYETDGGSSRRFSGCGMSFSSKVMMWAIPTRVVQNGAPR